MTAKSEQTRQALIDAGESLFAEHGVDNVSVAEITGAAGQKNGAAVHYHFGGRDGLLDAILERHHEQLDQIRLQGLEVLRFKGELTVRSLVELIVAPMGECLATDTGRAFLRIQAHRTRAVGGSHAEPSSAMVELRTELARRLPDIGTARSAERARLTTLMVNQRMGARAEEEARGDTEPARATVVSTLVDAVTAVLTAPGD